MKKSMLIFLYSIAACAAPKGFDLISGQAMPPQVDAQGKIHIQSTQNSVVHWDSFSLDLQETLIFDQAQETACILNRVVGSDPSEILGKLQSNGIVYLVNPKGIFIGPDGVVQTAGFLASTLDVLTEGFFTKNIHEFFSKNPGSIINLGTVSCPVGQITLLACSIDNQGELNGSVQAIACTKATLQIDAQRVFIQTDQKLDSAEDLQDLHASLRKNPYAHAIKHSGRITANTFGTRDGKVYLFAQGGTTDITGDIGASDIKLLGKKILLREQAIIDASTDAQGGKILVGGSYKGQDITIPIAESVLIDTQVHLCADALQAGDGGEIIIWSGENTEYLGSISAKGGAVLGNGGFAEISGAGQLRFEGGVDLTAANGATGHLLIDPDNITIIPSGTDSATGQVFNTPGDVSISGNDIGIALDSASLTLQATQNITIQDNISGSNGNALTLQAGASITTSGAGPFAITLNGGNFNAVFNSNGPLPPLANTAFFSANTLTLDTAGAGANGNIVIQQGTLANFLEGTIIFNGSTVNAGTGSFRLHINPNNNFATGIVINNTPITAGEVTLEGTGIQGGVAIANSVITNTGITVSGTATGSGSGIAIASGGIQTNSGDTLLNARGPSSDGIGISLNQGLISSINGSVTLNSTLGSIELNDGTVSCSGTGVLTVNAEADCTISAGVQASQMLVTTGIANFSIGRDLLLTSGSNTIAHAIIGTANTSFTGGSLEFSVGRNVSVRSITAQNYSLIGYGSPANSSNVTGNITFSHVGGDMVVQGANNRLGLLGFAQIGHLSGSGVVNTLNGDISLLVDGSISVIGGNESASNYAQIGHGGLAAFVTAGELTAIAGKNLIMQSNAAPANIVNAGGDVTLVVDNLFPIAPLMGPGFFSIQSNLSASEQLRIYTAVRNQNQIDDLINGSFFIPGTLFVNTSQEMWATYYPGGSYGGGPFTIYYKDGTLEGVGDVFQFAVSNAELSRYLPLVDPPLYQAKLEYFSLRELMCFDPYRRVLRFRTDQKSLTW